MDTPLFLNYSAKRVLLLVYFFTFGLSKMSQQNERTAYFASLCQQLYNPKSPEERNQAQKILEHSFPTFTDTSGLPPAGVDNQEINTPTDTASALRVLLESSPDPYVLTFALSRLKQLVQAQFALFNQDAKIQLRSFLLQYAFMHPDLLPFIITQLASVLAAITLLGWADVEQYKNVHKDILEFIQVKYYSRKYVYNHANQKIYRLLLIIVLLACKF